MDKGGNEAVRHKEHQSDRLTEPLVSLCQASSDQGQKQYYRAVCLSNRKNNNRCVPKPLEHPNSWEVGGLSVARKGVLHIALIHFFSLSLPFLESLAFTFNPPPSHARQKSLTLLSSPLRSLNTHSFSCALRYSVCPITLLYHCGERQERAAEREIFFLLAWERQRLAEDQSNVNK